jgi:hypothetical protein
MLVAVGALAEDGPQVVFPEPDFHFSAVLSGTVVEHEFTFKNDGTLPLRVEKTYMTYPLRATKMAGTVPPGETATLRFQLDTATLNSLFEGEIVVVTNDPLNPKTRLTFQGEVLPPIQLLPLPAFFVATQRGESKTAFIEIINHRDEPLEISGVESPSTRFVTELITVEPGKRYRLGLTLPGEGPAGRQTDTIILRTSSAKSPELKIRANTLVKDRVYSFPDKLDLGLLTTSELKTNPKNFDLLRQTLMVYQVGGKDFQISAQTDVSFLRLSPARSKFQDRYQIEITVVPERLKGGDVNGSIVISTNDPEFPQLVVPVKAVVEGSW